MCVKRLEILGSKPTETGEMLGMGEMQYNPILLSLQPEFLEQRDPNNVVSDGLKGVT